MHGDSVYQFVSTEKWWALGFVGIHFSYKGSNIRKKVEQFLEILSPYLYKIYMDHAERDLFMRKEVLAGHTFHYHPVTRYAVDVTFQQANMPSGTQ